MKGAPALFLCLHVLRIFALPEKKNMTITGQEPWIIPNVCSKLSSYWAPALNKRFCSYNDDVYLTAGQIIAIHGYRLETYDVTTDDGYILLIYRIPSKQNVSIPVLLAPGFAASSDAFTITANKSLAFKLADAGYDVWLINYRGTIYSRHKSLEHNSPKYLNFSFHEIGVYDIPSTIKLMQSHTKGKMIYIGHSMGTTAFHVFESTYRDYAKKTIRAAVHLAPEIFFSNTKLGIMLLQSKFQNQMALFQYLPTVNKTKPDGFVDVIIRILCKYLPPEVNVCHNAFYLSFVYNSVLIPPEYIPLILRHFPSGYSMKQVEHYIQLMNNDQEFYYYDYGKTENLKKYGRPLPPYYDVAGTQVSVFIFYSEHAAISDEKDALKLYNKLPKSMRLGLYKLNKLQHVDFIVGSNADKIVYEPLMETIKTFH